MKIEVNTNDEDLIESISDSLNDTEVLDFILKLEGSMSDWEFTEELLGKLVSQFIESGVTIGHKQTLQSLKDLVSITEDVV